MKKILFMSDLHCGSVVGLTPDEINYRFPGRYQEYRATMWHEYLRMLDRVGRVDYLVVVGDSVDGTARRSRFGELLLYDPDEQCECAVKCIERVSCSEIYMVNGTSYHVEYNQMPLEKRVALSLGAKIDDILHFKVYDTLFRVRHFVPGSTVPYGRATPLFKEKVWNILKSARGMEDKADVHIFGHRHSFEYIGDADGVAISLPCLQGMGSQYGKQKCTGTIDFGMLDFTVTEESYTWQAHTVVLTAKEDETFVLA